MDTACKKILIIDDDEAVRQSMKDVLEIKGYEVYTAADGKLAAELLGDLPANPCVILLDMMMPGMNGWEFLDFQRSAPKFSGIPVIVCSAFAATAKTVNADAIVPKPVELKTLVRAVESFCA